PVCRYRLLRGHARRLEPAYRGDTARGFPAYAVGSARPAWVNAWRRSAHLLQVPQCRPATGRMQEKVRCRGNPRPRRMTSALPSRAYGRRTSTPPPTAWLTTAWQAAKKAGVASAKGLDSRGARATAGTRCRWHHRTALARSNRLR